MTKSEYNKNMFLQALENKCNKIFLEYANKFETADAEEVIKRVSASANIIATRANQVINCVLNKTNCRINEILIKVILEKIRYIIISELVLFSTHFNFYDLDLTTLDRLKYINFSFEFYLNAYINEFV